MLGSAREPFLKERDIAHLKPDPPRGVVSTARHPGVGHARYLVGPALEPHLEHFWTVWWRLPAGQALVRETLPHPCFHVVVEGGVATVAGVARSRFTRVLEGRGRVFGAKFHPGAFRALLGASASSLTDRVVPLAQVVGPGAARRYARAIASARDDAQRVGRARAFWAGLLPPPPADAALLRGLTHAAATDRGLTTVEALRERAGLHLRELQRWFHDAVGVSPKWVIQRYRLHEALLGLQQRQSTVAALAARLGYADQAHFARDFKRLVGVAPSQYASQTPPAGVNVRA